MDGELAWKQRRTFSDGMAYATSFAFWHVLRVLIFYIWQQNRTLTEMNRIREREEP